MGTSYPDRTNATGLWKLSDITKNKVSDGTYPKGAVRAVCGGGDTPSVVNTIDFVQIESAGNATDFGDLVSARSNMAGTASHTPLSNW